MIAETLMASARKMGGHVVRDLQRLVRNKKYDFDDHGGMLVASTHVIGELDVFAPDGLGWQREYNLWTTEGKNHALDVVLHGTSANGTWYIAPFGGNVSVVDTWTAATFTASATELTTSYSESTRQAYVEAAASSGSTNNTASPATFTAATDAVSIYGAGLLSVSTKSSTSGVLLAASKYSSARVLAATSDTLGIRWTISL